MKRIRLINLILIMFCCCNMLAQNITVTGQVVDVTSEPIIGASVVVKGTANGTITNFDGKFTLSVQKGETLHISYIGYVAQDVKIMGNQPVKVVMSEDTETLDEVVVVGTAMKKSDLTGAVASVSSKVLEEKPVTNVNQALQGRVAGVFISQPTRPTDDASIKIRGINTINGSTDPIYVVDGMVMDNSFSGFNAVNLNDVASIEVLKDASATALYGSRGSNGVVVITTKKGKKGEGKVSYDGWIGFQTYANTPKTMNTRQLFELRKEAYTNGYMQTNPDGDVNAYINDVIMGSNTVFADYEFDAYNNNKNYDWQDAVSRTGVQHNHVVSLSNGNDKGSYYISFGYTDNKGVIEKSEQEKYTGRINADQQIKSWLKVGTNTTFTRTENTLVDDGVMNRARCANPMLEISDEIETLNWQGIFDQNNFNPLRSLKVDNDLVYNRLLSSNYININLIEGLNLRSTFSIDYAQKQQNKYTPNDIYESERYGTQGEAKDDRDTRTVNAYINDVIMGSNTVFADYEFDAYNNNKNYDWQDAVSRTGVQHNHVVSLSNGNDKGSYYISFGYTDNKGVIEKSEQEKYTGRINADQQIKSWLKVGTNTTFTRTENTLVDDGVMNRARCANPMLEISDEIETLNWQGIFDQNNFNPLRSLKVDNDLVYNRLLSSNYININLIEGLNLRSTFSIDYAQKQQNKYTPNDIYESERYGTQGEAKDDRDTRTVWQWDNSLSYEASFGKHKLNAMVGTSATRTMYNYINATATGFGTNLFGYHSLGSGYKKDQRGLSTAWSEQTLLSYIARVNYNYAGKYLLTATARYDGSSKFAKGNQWGIFPSVSAAWNITEEKFMKNQTIFDQLKLRAGFGIVGNQNIDDFAYLSLYNVSYTGTSDTGYTNSFVSNGRRGTPDISWEKQKQWNLGVDMAFLQNRVRLSVDAFLIKNKDLLMSHSLPTTTGFSSTIENIGAIENKGLEFALNANLVRAKDFEWNFAATLSMDKNKVTQLYGDNDVVYNVDSDRNIQKEGNLFLGESRNTIYIWKTGGIAQEIDMDRLNKINWNGYNVNPGDLYPLDYDNNGQIDQNDRVVIGSTDPKFYGGFSTDFSWKGLSLNAVFSYSYGAKKLSPWYETLIGSTGSGVASTDLLDRWTPENTDAEFPRVLAGFDYNHYGASSMDFSVQKASFLRLSALTLAYTFPTKVINALKLANLRVYATGSNLFCLTNYNGYDPETGDWYPPTRMYTFGLNLTF